MPYIYIFRDLFIDHCGSSARMEVSCVLCECSSKRVEHWELNSVFLHRSAARNSLEHATCAMRAQHIREPPPHPINGIKLICRVLACSLYVTGLSVSLTVVLASIMFILTAMMMIHCPTGNWNLISLDNSIGEKSHQATPSTLWLWFINIYPMWHNQHDALLPDCNFCGYVNLQCNIISITLSKNKISSSGWAHKLVTHLMGSSIQK